MSNQIFYQVNELGGGQWRREVTMADDYAVAQYAVDGTTMPRPAPRRWLWPTLTAASIFIACMVAAIGLGGHVAANGVSGYGGVAGSFPLALGGGSSTLAIVTHPLAAQAGGPQQQPLTPSPTVTAVAVEPSSNADLPHSIGDYHLQGAPSISVATIEKVLTQYGSPAVGNGQAFYDLGVKYGIDPAFMLAFYVHESGAGTQGAAVDTKSVGNIICAGWSGRCIGRFRAYDSYVQAAEDWYQLVTGPLYIGDGLDTPDKITPRYAPSTDNNDPNGYAKTVERLVDQWRSWQQ